jgi:hypothetical protein
VFREANRSKLFTTRQRSTTESSQSSTDTFIVRKKPKRFQQKARNSLGPEEGLKAIEPLHDPSLVKMAFAEQQQWITVQQKTFTKWWVKRKTDSKDNC